MPTKRGKAVKRRKKLSEIEIAVAASDFGEDWYSTWTFKPAGQSEQERTVPFEYRELLQVIGELLAGRKFNE